MKKLAISSVVVIGLTLSSVASAALGQIYFSDTAKTALTAVSAGFTVDNVYYDVDAQQNPIFLPTWTMGITNFFSNCQTFGLETDCTISPILSPDGNKVHFNQNPNPSVLTNLIVDVNGTSYSILPTTVPTSGKSTFNIDIYDADTSSAAMQNCQNREASKAASCQTVQNSDLVYAIVNN